MVIVQVQSVRDRFETLWCLESLPGFRMIGITLNSQYRMTEKQMKSDCYTLLPTTNADEHLALVQGLAQSANKHEVTGLNP